jgi:ketol-acid reductoisomerase
MDVIYSTMLLVDFITKVETDIIGANFNAGKDNGVDNRALNAVNKALRTHSIEIVGDRLRAAMGAMKTIVTVA